MKTVLCLVDTRLISREGYSASIKADVPTQLPDVLVPLAMQRGCKILGDYVVASEPAVTTVSKDEKIRVAIGKLISDGDPAHFKKDGTPTSSAVKALVDVPVSASDVFDVWTKMLLDDEFRAEITKSTSTELVPTEPEPTEPAE